MRSHWLWLSLKTKLTTAQKLQLIEFMGGIEHLYNADAQSFRGVGFINRVILEQLLDKSMDEVLQIQDTCEKRSISFVTIQDSGYPARLRGIANPPLVLYYLGRLPDFESRPLVGIVGTRMPSAGGAAAAHKFGAEIAACGGIVVSGGALGVDMQALQGADQMGMPTVTVLAGGLDRLYPREHEKSFLQLCQRGCLITECPPGGKVYKGSFLQRNRIISGMSNGVVVVEAPASSGALNTAQWARSQGRDVFALPGCVDAAECAGSNALLADGARTAVTGWDVLRVYAPAFPYSVRQSDGEVVYNSFAPDAQPPKKTAAKPRKKKENDKKDIDKTAPSAYSVIEKPLPPLSEAEQLLVDRLKNGPVLCHFLAAEAGVDTGELMRLLTLLSMKNVVHTAPDGMVYLK